MRDIVHTYIDYLYRELNANELEYVLSIKPGEIVLRNTPEHDLFEHPHVKLWHKFLLYVFEPPYKPLALIAPCTAKKPYRLSPTHRIIDHRLKAYRLKDLVEVYVLSEPMILVPRELDIYYPFANYDYPPDQLDERHRELFINLLTQVLPKLRIHRYIVAVLPKHHKNILLEALNRANTKPKIEVLDYDRLAFKSVARAVDKLRVLIEH